MISNEKLMVLFRKRLPETPETVIQAMVTRFRAAEILAGHELPLAYANTMVRNFHSDLLRKQEAAIRMHEQSQIRRAREATENLRLAVLNEAKTQFQEMLEMPFLEEFVPSQIDAVFWLGELVFEGKTWKDICSITGLSQAALNQRCSRIRKHLRPFLVERNLTVLVTVCCDSRISPIGGSAFKVQSSG